MFERFNVPSLYFANRAVLALFSIGQPTGIVLDSGYGITHVIPVYNGKSIKNATQTLEIGGNDVTYYLAKLLSEKGYSFTTKAEIEIIREMKEKLGFLSLYPNDSNAYYPNLEKLYELPDGQSIHLSTERFNCAEILFQPNLIELNCPGIDDLLFTSINLCAADIRKHIYQNIFITGGNTKLKGFVQRLEQSIPNYFPEYTNVIIRKPDMPSWLGGSILASLPIMDNLWIHKSSYEEYGERIIHQACIF